MAQQLSPLNEQRISGPYTLFSGSFILEFLKPDPSRDATVLMRCTYKYDHPLCRKGRGHPQRPPLHLHFDQIESFEVLSGSIGTTTGYDTVQTIHRPGKTYRKGLYVPHDFWPDPDATEDSTLILWAHPEAVPEPMDGLFFKNLLLYISDVSEGKAKLDVLQIMYAQHVTASALVMFPSAWWLGGLRWRIPWYFQGLCATVAKLFGYSPLMKAYTTEEDLKVFRKVGSSE